MSIAALLVLWLDVATLMNHSVVAGERICDAAGLRTFYARRGGLLAWDASTKASLIRALDHLSAEGLDPNHYHRAALGRLPSGVESDVLATDAFLIAATHLSHGVVDPQFVRPAWCPPPAHLDLAAILQSALDNHLVEETLARLAPRSQGYARLRSALAVYRAIADAGGWNVLPRGTRLRLGVDDPRVPDLRSRLAREQPAAGSPVVPAAVNGPSTLFDSSLEIMVRQFQAHHGLTADGVVGPETLRELNVPAADRARQIALNMERWRWMPEDPGKSYVIVNIAAFHLDVMEGERAVLSMKTVVGKEYTKTPFFAARITDIDLNPWWNVPDSIANKELWPKQQRNRAYFAQEHMVVTKGRIRQLPGPWNSLGRIKFNMPNPNDVYLHDTPAKELFTQAFRAFSHGCIRLERPLDLAMLLLRDQPRWTAAEIEGAIASGEERFIPLTNPEPVYVLYWTVRTADDGLIEFDRDPYHRDPQLAAALR